jgi:hypothetical protein
MDQRPKCPKNTYDLAGEHLIDGIALIFKNRGRGRNIG